MTLYIYLHDQRKYIQECRELWLILSKDPFDLQSYISHMQPLGFQPLIMIDPVKANRLERESVASGTNNRGLDLARIKKARDGVRGLSQSTLSGSVLAISKVVARLNSISSISRVKRLLRVDKDVVLYKQLCALAGVDTIRHVLVVVVIEVACAEAERGSARVQVVQVVVGVGDSQVALVLRSVGVGVADQRCFPVVVQEGVGHGDEVSGVGDVEKAIIVVLVVIAVGREVEVIDPDVLGLEPV